MTDSHFHSAARILCMVVAIVLPGSTGCNRTATSRLVGQWEGRPDSADAYARRQQALVGNPHAIETSNDHLVGNTRPTAVIQQTDVSAVSLGDRTELEQYDLRIVLNLRADGTVVMWHDNHQDELSGIWTVVDAVGPQVRLQIVAHRKLPAPQTDEIRIFQLELADDGNAFTLSEEGADPQFGSLYFRRQSQSRTQSNENQPSIP